MAPSSGASAPWPKKSSGRIDVTELRLRLHMDLLSLTPAGRLISNDISSVEVTCRCSFGSRLNLSEYQGEREMRPENGLRRRVIREWMLLPRSKRQSQEQAVAFAAKVVQSNTIGGHHRADPHKIVMAWLAPRIGR
jgi:hypothetical protein